MSRIELTTLDAEAVAAEVADQFTDIITEFIHRCREQENAKRSLDSVYVEKDGVMTLSGSIKFGLDVHLLNGGASLQVTLEAKQPGRAARGRQLMFDKHGKTFQIVPKDDQEDPLPFEKDGNR